MTEFIEVPLPADGRSAVTPPTIEDDGDPPVSASAPLPQDPPELLAEVSDAVVGPPIP